MTITIASWCSLVTGPEHFQGACYEIIALTHMGSGSSCINYTNCNAG